MGDVGVSWAAKAKLGTVIHPQKKLRKYQLFLSRSHHLLKYPSDIVAVIWISPAPDNTQSPLVLLRTWSKVEITPNSMQHMNEEILFLKTWTATTIYSLDWTSQPVAIDPDTTTAKLDLLDNIAQSPTSMDGRFQGLNSSPSTTRYSRPIYSNIQAKLRSEIRSVCSYGSMSGNVSEAIPFVDLQLCYIKFPLEQELDAVGFPPIEQETGVDDGDTRQECIPKHLLSQQSNRDHFEHGQGNLTLVCGIESQIDYTMNRWTYEIADANLPVAERLEKSHWETRQRGRL